MLNSDEFVQAFDKFRDDHPEWTNMVPYAVARLFWDAGAEFAASNAPDSGITTASHVTVYTVRRSPYTAAAKTSAGYNSVEMEYVADSAAEALDKAVKDCTWQNPTQNFRFHAISSKVVATK